jgi:glycosyltransferase involved in cell wall biosynthesis
MKILFVSSRNNGTEPISDRQANSLIDKSIVVDIFPIKGKGLFGYVKNILPLRGKIDHESPDLIHAHYGLSGILAFLANHKKKLIVSFMGDDILGSNNSNGSITLVSKWMSRINIVLARKVYDYSIVKNNEMLERINCNRSVRIPNGVDLGVYKVTDKQAARSYLKLGDEIKLVLFVSNPERVEKNYKLAEEAIAQLKEKKEDIMLFCIYEKDQEELVNYYNAADLLLLTSFHEGSPNVVKEAMSCNCPVVSTDVGDVKWLFGETQGHYITGFNPYDVAEKIELALEFRKKQLLTKGRERIIELGLDSDTISGKIIEVYNKVLNY